LHDKGCVKDDARWRILSHMTPDVKSMDARSCGGQTVSVAALEPHRLNPLVGDVLPILLLTRGHRRNVRLPKVPFPHIKRKRELDD